MICINISIKTNIYDVKSIYLYINNSIYTISNLYLNTLIRYLLEI